MKLLLSILLSVSHCVAAYAETWPGWLGPERNGRVADFVPPNVWPKSLEKAWQYDAGEGYATPIVLAQRVFCFSRQGENEVIACLDLTSGEEIWKTSYAVPFKVGGGGEWHGKGPKSNPYLADGRIFTLSISGVLSAWNAEDGQRLWYRDYSNEYKDFEKATPYWGACTSPIADGNLVFLHFGTDEFGELLALDVATGKEVWKHSKEGASYASPLIVEINGVRQFVEWNHRSLAAFEIHNGKLLWEFPFAHVGTNQNMPSPVIYDGSILVGGENRGIRRVEPTLEDGQWSAKEIWHQKKVALDMSTAILSGDRLFGFSHYKKGQLFCLAAETGEILWTGPGRAGSNATFLSFRQHVAALLDHGELLIFKATSDKLETVAKYQVSDQPTWAAPVLLRSGMLVKDRSRLLYLKLPTD